MRLCKKTSPHGPDTAKPIPKRERRPVVDFARSWADPQVVTSPDLTCKLLEPETNNRNVKIVSK